MPKNKIEIDHSKVTSLGKIGFEDKIVICDQIDEDDQIKVVLWLESTNFKGKKRISLNGAAHKRTSLDDEFVMQKSDVLGHHRPNKNGEETIKSSVEPYSVKSLYESIVNWCK
jgi:hypothetical protein